MNFFLFWKNDQGEDELITPPLDGTILPGITRDSILKLMRELGEFKVSEKPFKIQTMVKAVQEGRVYEAFGAGTAAIVSPVKSFSYLGETWNIPIDEQSGAGKLTQRVLKIMLDLQYGVTKRPAW
jgi:branched-chain amino acid aminotransferase